MRAVNRANSPDDFPFSFLFDYGNLGTVLYVPSAYNHL